MQNNEGFIGLVAIWRVETVIVKVYWYDPGRQGPCHIKSGW
jgi:hypothetical protein